MLVKFEPCRHGFAPPESPGNIPIGFSTPGKNFPEEKLEARVRPGWIRSD